MALPNIELHEQLKKDISEAGARMIAEVVPAAGDLATRADLAELELRLKESEHRLERRIGDAERRSWPCRCC